MTNKTDTLLSSYPGLFAHAGGSGVLLGMLGVLELNLNGLPFPGWSTQETRRAVADALLAELRKMRRRRWTYCAQLSELSAEERYLLLERGQLTAPMAARQDGVYVLTDAEQMSLCLINDEEHLLVQTFYPGAGGNRAEQVVEDMQRLRDALAAKLPVAHDPAFGFLAGDPSKCGEALYISYLVHLPGLRLAKHLQQSINALEDMNIYTSSLFPCCKDEPGDLCLVHSPATPQHKLRETLERMQSTLADLAHQELNARARLMQGAKTAPRIKRAVAEALHMLSTAKQLSYRDTIESLSLIRFGMHTGILSTPHPGVAELLSRAYVDTAPAHLRRREGLKTQRSSRSARAAYIRRLVAEQLCITLPTQAE